jgi:hypothetical protein
MLLTTATGILLPSQLTQNVGRVRVGVPRLWRDATRVQAIRLFPGQPGMNGQPRVRRTVRLAGQIPPRPHVRELGGQLVGRAAAVDRAPPLHRRCETDEVGPERGGECRGRALDVEQGAGEVEQHGIGHAITLCAPVITALV